MGDRFYTQQGQKAKIGQNGKPMRRLKKDIASDIQDLLIMQIPGLENSGKAVLEKLLEGIKNL